LARRTADQRRAGVAAGTQLDVSALFGTLQNEPELVVELANALRVGETRFLSRRRAMGGAAGVPSCRGYGRAVRSHSG